MRAVSYLVAVSSKPQLVHISRWPQTGETSGAFYIDSYREGVKMLFEKGYFRYQIIKGFTDDVPLDTWVEFKLVYKPFGVFAATDDQIITDLYDSTNPGHPEDPYPFDTWREGTGKGHKILWFKRVMLNNNNTVQAWGWKQVRMNKLIMWNGPEGNDHEHGEMILFVRSWALSAAESTQKPIVNVRWDIYAKDIGGEKGEYFLAP